MEEGHDDQAIKAFSCHAKLLLSKMDQYKGEKKKIDAINQDLEMIYSFLKDLQFRSFANTNTFKPISARNEALEEELNRYPKIAKDTIKRMITYKFPNLTFSNIIGHEEAKDVLLRALVNPIKDGSLFDDDDDDDDDDDNKSSRTTGILLFGNYSSFKIIIHQLT